MYPASAASSKRRGRDKSGQKTKPRISTNYTKEAETCMGGPSAPSDSPSGREKQSSSLPLGLSLVAEGPPMHASASFV